MVTQSQQSVYDYFLKHGVPAANAAGAVGVLTAEAGPNLATGAQANAATDTGGALSTGAYGIASWNGPRQQALLDYAKSTGQSPSALDAQAGFFLHEMQTRNPKTYAKLMDPNAGQNAVVSAIVTNYEQPANPAAEISKAAATAAEIGNTGNPYAPGGMFYNQLSHSNKSAVPNSLGGIPFFGSANTYGPQPSAGNAATQQTGAQVASAAASGITGLVNNYFTRGAIIFLGIIFIAGALYMFGTGEIKNAG